ncbi:uncharacterized protein LOC120993641 [Bufo bufo]|uniref:uncharacterized protein LOC120993641 n=1 Tax=Bufo bufo TaxID=8384 RepID=UPI001ABE77EE|nr:uncharacterized protein LOC120993641 [Bufo bufo]
MQTVPKKVATKKKKCPICKCSLSSSYAKKLCQQCIEKTVAEETPSLLKDIKSIMSEVKNSLKAGRKRRRAVRQESDVESEGSGSLSGDEDSNDSFSSEDDTKEGKFLFPAEDTDKLLKVIRSTLELEYTRENRSVEDVVFGGLRERKRRCFPVHKSVSAVIEKEWKKPDKKTFISKTFKRKYPFEEEASTSWDRAPKLDVAISKISKKSALPFEDMGFLRDPLDKRIDSSLKNLWESSAAAFRPSIAATVVARSMSLWLDRLEGQIRDKCPREQLLASMPTFQKATDFIADVAVDAVRLEARAASLSNSARRALWLKNWKGGDMPSKLRLQLDSISDLLFGTKVLSTVSHPEDDL